MLNTDEVFSRAEFVGRGKHAIWRGLTDEELAQVVPVVRSAWGCSEDQERFSRNSDNSWNYEAVYGCEDDGRYGIEDYDGTVVIGPNRRELRRRFPLGTDVVVFYDGGEYRGFVARHNRKSLTVNLVPGEPWAALRLSWAAVEQMVEKIEL